MMTGFIIGLCIIAIVEYFSLKRLKSKNDVRIAELQKQTAERYAEAARLNLRAAEAEAKARKSLSE